MEEQVKQLQDKVAKLEADLAQLNGACVRDSLRLSAYMSLLIRRGVFAPDELEGIGSAVEAELAKIRAQQSGDGV